MDMVPTIVLIREVPGVDNLVHILTMRIIWRDIPGGVTEATGTR